MARKERYQYEARYLSWVLGACIVAQTGATGILIYKGGIVWGIVSIVVLAVVVALFLVVRKMWNDD